MNLMVNDADFGLNTVCDLTLTGQWVSSLKGVPASGFDEFLTDMMFKQNVDHWYPGWLAQPLFHLVNLSLSSGVFPNLFKLVLTKNNNNILGGLLIGFQERLEYKDALFDMFKSIKNDNLPLTS